MLGAAIVAVVLAIQTVFEITLPWVALGTPLLSTRNPCTRYRHLLCTIMVNSDMMRNVIKWSMVV